MTSVRSAPPEAGPSQGYTHFDPPHVQYLAGRLADIYGAEAPGVMRKLDTWQTVWLDDQQTESIDYVQIDPPGSKIHDGAPVNGHMLIVGGRGGGIEAYTGCGIEFAALGSHVTIVDQNLTYSPDDGQPRTAAWNRGNNLATVVEHIGLIGKKPHIVAHSSGAKAAADFVERGASRPGWDLSETKVALVAPAGVLKQSPLEFQLRFGPWAELQRRLALVRKPGDGYQQVLQAAADAGASRLLRTGAERAQQEIAEATQRIDLGALRGRVAAVAITAFRRDRLFPLWRFTTQQCRELLEAHDVTVLPSLSTYTPQGETSSANRRDRSLDHSALITEPRHVAAALTELFFQRAA